MVKITFIQPNGVEQALVGVSGDTVLDVALDNGIVGIKGQCGGGCTCCTCHCWVYAPWFSRLDEPHQDELDMLEYAWGRSQHSRLACQVVLRAELDGIRVDVPEQQS